MPSRRSPSYAVYSALDLQKLSGSRKRTLRTLLLLLLVLAIITVAGGLYLRRLSSELALSDAIDAVNLAVSDSVYRVLERNDYHYDYFVTLERDDTGAISAITTNTTHINSFSAEFLRELVQTASSGTLHVRIPLGNLLGFNLLLGKGPDIPVKITMLTSSFVRYDNDLISTGINQSRHVITLKAAVDVDILVPWRTISTTVDCDVLIAETIILGRVPDTYIDLGEVQHGSS